jgi:hypothetical protein
LGEVPAIVEFRNAVDAVRCAIEVRNAMVERNAGAPPCARHAASAAARRRDFFLTTMSTP